jgi:DNA-binding response OmpR family regulator
MRILLIEDDKQMAHAVRAALENYFIVEIALTGEKGEQQLQINNYDLVILDWVLPDTNGLALCERIRKLGLTVPILMLTGQDEVEKKVMSLNAGADDYLTKPFRFEELLARIRALLRRRSVEIVPTTLTLDDLIFDLNKRSVKRNGSVINLRRKELYLLEYLMKNIGRVITREMILDQIWDSSNESLTNIVDVHIKYLRDKIDKPFDKKLIKTVHGFGYKMEG